MDAGARSRDRRGCGRGGYGGLHRHARAINPRTGNCRHDRQGDRLRDPLLVGGAWAWIGESPFALMARLRPFLSTGPGGLLQAMGYTFIALQGFDLIVAGEIRDPKRTVPRAMYLSLGIAFAIYLPRLLLATVGAAGPRGIGPVAARNPEGLVAEAAGIGTGVGEAVPAGPFGPRW